MFIVKIADLNIAIDNKYNYVESLCKDYISLDPTIDFIVSADESEINKEMALSCDNGSLGFTESICIYRNIAKALPKYNAFVMHCAAIDFHGKALCFAAKSGTGKTTHINLWRSVYGDRVKIINGDKPIFRLKDGRFHVYGTPWSGKERYNRNAEAPLEAIYFLKQNVENSITKINELKALGQLLRQVYMPDDPNDKSQTLNLLDTLLLNTSFWELNCNISEEAVFTASKVIV